ncbi:stonustoxin subunit beta-like [Chaetodon auriga]|uniref:stonustoxin subunit beta-like n=1 Tax=Chaetodon auriga TaxID=39042 RepID=UPI004033086B
MSSDILMVPALGRPFTLGTLYDARQDKLIPSFTLWDDDILEQSTFDFPQPSSAFEITASDSIEGKSSLLDVEASLKASFLGGLIEVGGSARYLNDTKKFKNQSRVTLQYKVTTNFKQLMTALGSKHIGYSDLFKNIQATHVVIGILYGANAFFVFDSQKLESSNIQEVQGNMEAAIRKIPACDISGKGTVQLTDAENAVINNFSCRFHGDIFLSSNPTSFQEAVKTYQQLPQIMGKENAVPVTVWLVPLTNFYSQANKLAAESSTLMLRKVRSTMEAMKQLNMRCNDSLEDDIVKLFPQIKKKLYNFQNLCNDYMLHFQQTIAKTLLSFRSGEVDESAFLKVYDENLRSPFNIDSLNEWLQCEEKEINVIRSCMDIIKGANYKIVSSRSQMISELFDSKVKHTVCFLFTSLVDDDPFLKVLTDFFCSPEKTVNPKKLRPPVKDYWYASDDVGDTMREKAQHFSNLAKEMDSRFVLFLVAAMENAKQEGAGIHYYREGILITDEFTAPNIPPVEKIQDRRDLLWYDCYPTLDPDTVHAILTLSEGNKCVVSGKWQSYPDIPERFNSYQQVMCKEGLSGRHYWEMEWSGYVRTGVTYRGIKRKTWVSDVSLGHNDKSWILDYYPPGGYTLIHNYGKTPVHVSSHGFKRLGVYLDWPAGTLSFYMVTFNKVSHLHTSHTKFNEPVYPASMVGFPGASQNGQIRFL